MAQDGKSADPTAGTPPPVAADGEAAAAPPGPTTPRSPAASPVPASETSDVGMETETIEEKAAAMAAAGSPPKPAPGLDGARAASQGGKRPAVGPPPARRGSPWRVPPTWPAMSSREDPRADTAGGTARARPPSRAARGAAQLQEPLRRPTTTRLHHDPQPTTTRPHNNYHDLNTTTLARRSLTARSQPY